MSDSSSTDHISADIPGIHGTSHEFADLTDAEIFNAHQGGKIATTSRLNLETIRDLSIAYTPGVARVCEAIHEDPSLATTTRGQGATWPSLRTGLLCWAWATSARRRHCP